MNSPLAGKLLPESLLVNVPALLAAYSDLRPDVTLPAQCVAFGTSGHRGSSLHCSFNEWHVLAITQAICDYRWHSNISGPLFLGRDTHALSQPAFDSTLTVLAANGVQTHIDAAGEYTPTPAISHAILSHNRGRRAGLADGIVITPSHNPPESGGIKYNPANGGPANTQVTHWIETRANALLAAGLNGVRRLPLSQARQHASIRVYPYLRRYVDDLHTVLDLDAIRSAGLRLGVDPLGGAGVHYWPAIAERYRLDLTVVSDIIDPTFRFMAADHDGQIRMDPSSPFAMQRLLGLKDRFDIAFACDTDHDRHGIVTRHAGLLPANHYLVSCIDYLFQQRRYWSPLAGIGKTVVSTGLIDRLAEHLGRRLYEVPVGFKWFVEGLLDSSLAFAGEESAGATLSRQDGSVWTTDKDGMVLALLAAEITACSGRDPGEHYHYLTRIFGVPVADRVEATATREQKSRLARLSAAQLKQNELAGETIGQVLTQAPGNHADIGGIKVITANGWFAARPSGTEDSYRIYAESFRDEAHLHSILQEARQIVDEALQRP